MIAIVGFMAFAAIAQTPTSPAPTARPDGKALYREKCIMCHDATGMGTGILSRRVKVPELLLRTDLNPIFVVAAARTGIGNMPPIPRGEASDLELQTIADYLALPPEARE
jgi:mono/diheme cytochrome c family protein